MSASLHQPQQDPGPVAGTVGGRVIQTIQGTYYVVAGVCTVLGVLTLQLGAGSWFRAPYLLAQAVGVAVAGFGAALFWSGSRSAGPFLSAMVSMCVAIGLLVLSAVGAAAGILSPVFLLDTGLEFMFACWWAAAVLMVNWIEPASGPS